MKRSIEKLRVEYGNTPLLEEDLCTNPVDQFEKWLYEAIDADVFEPNGFVLATVSEMGRPASRTVLLKELGPNGFVFYTDSVNSRKSKHLENNPYASLTFWWKEIYRQVHVEGRVEKVPRSQTTAYFDKRPKGAQIAASISTQSAPLATRLELEEKVSQFTKEHKGKDVHCPKHWGGYLVKPERMEFWQGRQNRLHDRFLYVLANEDWVITRLYP